MCVCAPPCLSEVSQAFPQCFQCSSDWQWPSLVLSRKMQLCFKQNNIYKCKLSNNLWNHSVPTGCFPRNLPKGALHVLFWSWTILKHLSAYVNVTMTAHENKFQAPVRFCVLFYCFLNPPPPPPPPPPSVSLKYCGLCFINKLHRMRCGFTFYYCYYLFCYPLFAWASKSIHVVISKIKKHW